MSERGGIPEQDQEGPGDDLPTYDDLAEKHGPNSRFGRWRSWIEKRAAERYTDITSEELARRRERGWGNNIPTTPSRQPEQQEWAPQPSGFPPQGGSAAARLQLHVQTTFNKPLPSPPIFPEEEPSEDAPPLIGQPLSPTHINLHQFGSRFLPHTNAPIRCLLPLLGDKLLLIGHDDGLSVLNMFPQEWTETGGLRNKGPAEAQAHAIWQGESVLQLSIVEVEDIGEGIPQGVVLALVGSESEHSKEPDGLRSLRMYNLASLISLAKWAISQKGSRPLDLRRPANWSPQQSNHKKHKSHASLAKGLKSLMPEGQRAIEPSSSYHRMLPSAGSSRASVLGQPPPSSSTPRRGSSESGWDLVDDLPLRWATDYVPLASAGSRLVNTSVLSYDLWRDERQVRGGALLAVATKSNILLYESPKGERAFRFVKDFYTPLTPRSVTFVRQTISDPMSRSPSDATGSRQPPQSQSHVRLSPAKEHSRQRHTSMVIKSVVFGNQLSLFVVFEKKAGLIRLADSSVGEVELYDDCQALSPVSAPGSLPTRKSRMSVSYDQLGFAREPKGHWAPPATVELQLASKARFDVSQGIHLLTRGKQTHILPSPLPPDLAAYPPLTTLAWQSPPSYVAPRVVYPASADERAYLQVVAFGEDGLETQELSLSFLGGGVSNGKARADEPVHAQAEFGVDSGFLAHGGHWHRPPGAPLERAFSTRSSASTLTFDSTTEELVAALRRDEGMYGWQRKGVEDWRVVWLGGAGRTQPPGAHEDYH